MSNDLNPYEPTDYWLYLLHNGPFNTLVVRGLYLAEPLAELLHLQTILVRSLEHAQEVLMAIYGQVSAHKVIDVTDYVVSKPVPTAWVRVETDEGLMRSEVVSDPDVIETLKEHELYPE